jgi:hypothetical protein
MTKLKQDFELYQGETKVVTINVDLPDGTAWTGTGADIVFRAVRVTHNGHIQGSLEKKDADITLVNVDGTDDGVRFTILPEETRELMGEYEHETRAVDATGQEAVLALGKMTVKHSHAAVH